MKNLMFAATLALGSAAHAADTMNFHSLGFSPNGQYYGFIQSVIQDGSGFAEADAAIIDVAHNKMVARERVILEKDNSTEPQAMQVALSRLQPGKYGIDQRNQGQTLWMRSPTDVGPEALHAEFTADADARWPRYALDITNIAVTPKDQDFCMQDQVSMLELKLTRDDRGDVSAKDLQKDAQLPTVRKCALGYELRQVIQYKKELVVVVRYNQQGFEGQDLIYMVVTAKNAL